MKRTYNNFKWGALLACIIVVLFTNSCQKEDALVYAKPTSKVSVIMFTSATNIVLDTTNASKTQVLNLSWIPADYGVNLSVNYTIELDSTAFTNPTEINVGNATSKEFDAQSLNLLILSMGATYGKPHNINVKVRADISSVQKSTTSVYSNPITLTITPYSLLPKPKYPVPDSLYLVGDATAGGWSNPVPLQSQHFTKIDANTFAIVTQLTGGKQYLLLPVNGDWGHKYNPSAAGSNPAGDTFAPDAGGNNMVGPAADGLYQITVDFVKAKYTVTAVTSNPVPDNLYIVGDATAGGWNNPVPTPSQQFKKVSMGEYQITLPLSGAKSYLFLPVNGDWSHKYGGTSAPGGALLADGAVPGSNTPSPASDGTYLINVNFFSKTYTVTQQ